MAAGCNMDEFDHRASPSSALASHRGSSGEGNLLSRLVDRDGCREPFLDDMLLGLLRRPKELPCKYFYDRRGSELFDQICELPEYYLTRAEVEILEQAAPEIAECVGPYCELVEYGAGSCRKIRILLNAVRMPLALYAIDISGDYLVHVCHDLQETFPDLDVRPVIADYTSPVKLPDPPMVHGTWESHGIMRTARRVGFFPGSTIGNFAPEEAVGFLRNVGRSLGRGGAILVGVDLKKDPAVLEAAYDDPAGVTARFNLNLLARANRELGADFDLEAFQHSAFYNPEFSRIEMHLVSLKPQAVHLGGHTISFRAGETIWTESSYKYSLLGFAAIAARAGFHVDRVWTDERKYFSVQLLVAQ